MSDRSNRPCSLPDIRASSRQEPDETLYPSRIARKQVGLRLPADEVREAKVFCAVNNIELQDLTSLGWKLAMAEIAETGQPANQLTSQPLIDQKRSLDEKKMEDKDQTIIDHRSVDAAGYPANQLKERLIDAIRGKLGPQPIDSWFMPLQLKREGDLVIVCAPSPVVRDFISENWADAFAAAMAEVGAAEFRWQEFAPAPQLEPGPQEAPEKRADRWLNFYAIITGNRIWPTDHASFLKVVHCSDQAIECGILRSRIKVAGGKMRSFNYCLKAIFQIHESGVALHLLPKLRHEWQQMLPGFESKVRTIRKD